MKLKIISLIIICCAIKGMSQTTNIHAHNDYDNNIPFWNAYSAGAQSIEVDILLKNNNLYVAHEVESIQKQKTLEHLYLEPISRIFDENIIHSRPFILLVDIKTEASPTISLLIEKLKPIQKHLYPYSPDGVKVVISGNRPEASNYNHYPKHIFFDHQSTDLPVDLTKIAMLSFDFKTYSSWNGKGKIVKKEEDNLKKLIAFAKKHHLPIRFWANPDTKSGWYALKKLGIDFLGTDNPLKAKTYLNNLSKNDITVDCGKTHYQPKYKVDNTNKNVKNVILFIGDGMGLAQISTAANFCSDMVFNQLKSIGFIKTNSKNDYTTDSAAGATAFACGEKTNNRAIGVDENGEAMDNLLEILSTNHYKTGILTTDEITGATPAAFYAHATDRGLQYTIAQQLISSPIDFFMGGGNRFFTENNLKDSLHLNGFEIINDFENLNASSAKRIAFFAGENSLPYWRNGRNDLLPNATEFAINHLKDQPFFIMVEAAQIDNYGHFNDLKGVAEETIDLDHAIQKAIEFADLDGETLVIITADHECGGLTIPHGNISNNQLEGEFSTHDHTGIMVPVFAYGPQSSEFQGIYDNHQIFHKILNILNLK